MLPLTTSIMAMLFVCTGGIAVFIMLEIFGKIRDNTEKTYWIYAHKIFGYLFLSIFILMLFFMINKTAGFQKELTARAIIHIVLALILIPLLAVKIMIARRYPKLGAKLPMLGISIFTISFGLTGITAGYYALYRSNLTYTTISSLNNGLLDLELGKTITNKKCNKCHSLERVYLAYKNDNAWSDTINKMALLDSPNITSFDVKQMLNYLIQQQKKREMDNNLNMKIEIGKTLVSRKCSMCHDLDRVLGTKKDEKGWMLTMSRMTETMGDPNFLSEQEKADIISYLTGRKINR